VEFYHKEECNFAIHKFVIANLSSTKSESRRADQVLQGFGGYTTVREEVVGQGAGG
jgi:hypothetical protein